MLINTILKILNSSVFVALPFDFSECLGKWPHHYLSKPWKI